MSAEIVELAAKRKPPNPGNGARESVNMGFHALRLDSHIETADLFLIWLWDAGFKVIPLEDKDLIA